MRMVHTSPELIATRPKQQFPLSSGPEGSSQRAEWVDPTRSDDTPVQEVGALKRRLVATERERKQALAEAAAENRALQIQLQVDLMTARTMALTNKRSRRGAGVKGKYGGVGVWGCSETDLIRLNLMGHMLLRMKHSSMSVSLSCWVNRLVET